MSEANEHAPGPHGHPGTHDETRGRVGMWLFICTEILLFGGLFLLYSAYRFKHPADFHQASSDLNRFDGTLNTIVLTTRKVRPKRMVAAR